MPNGTDGGTQDGQGQGGAGTATRGRLPTRRVDKRIAELAQEYGSKHAALHQLTTKLLTLEEENDGLRAKLPGEGAVVLAKEDAATWAAYQKLGKPGDLEATAKKAADLEAKDAQRTRADKLREAGEAVGYKPTVLTKLAETEGFELVEMRDEQVDGKAVRVPYVKKSGDQAATPVKLTDFAAQHLGEFLPALTAAGNGGQGGGRSDGGQQAPRNGPAYPAQAAQSSAAGDQWTQYRRQVEQEREAEQKKRTTTTAAERITGGVASGAARVAR